MDLLDQPAPFKEAIQHLLGKEKMPTTLSSADLKQLDAAIKRQSLFSARTNLEYHLDNISAAVESILNPKTEQRADRVTDANPHGNVTTGMNPATARAALRDALKANGYSADPEDKGGIKDLASDERLNLVVKTNVQLAQGAGAYIQGNDAEAVNSMPAWELIRYEDREVPRGERRVGKAIIPDPDNSWESRFEDACEEAGDDDALAVLKSTGRMVALKSSDVWQALGDGAGGHDDTLNNPFPPFAFNSGMWTEGVTYQECVDLGLLEPGEKVEPADLDIGGLFQEAA